MCVHQNEGINTDIDTVNEVISCLSVTGHVEEAFNVLERLNSKSFGSDVVGDLNSYTHLISHGGNSSKAHIRRLLFVTCSPHLSFLYFPLPQLSF